MKYLWFIDNDDDIWKITEDYSYSIIYHKRDNYIIPYSWETTKIGFNDYKRFYKFKEISEDVAILEIL